MRMKLTKRAVDSLKPSEKPIIVFDEELPAMVLRVMPSGVKTFMVMYRNAHGQQRWYKLGRIGETTPDKARQHAQDVLAEVRRGADPSGAKKQKRKGMTLAEFWLEYRKYSEARKKPKSLVNDLSRWNRYISKLAKRRLDSITAQDIERLLSGLSAVPIQANRTRGLLVSMFQAAIKWGLMTGPNPAQAAERYKEGRRERFLSPEELAKIGKALMDCEQKQLLPRGVVPAIRMLAFTGCRLREVLHLSWAEVNLPGKRLMLKDSKTGARSVVLNEAACEILQSIPHDGDYLFPGPTGKPLNEIRKSWTNICRMAEVTDARLHDLRHAVASVAVGEGVGLPLVAGLLGHKRLSTSERYSHLYSDPVQAASEMVGRAMSELMMGDGAEIVEVTPATTKKAKTEAAGA
ncbi:MAG: site-specific integrase [Candidatus Sumerlaeota bacterium]|nr:site-specific integrase [Candidatus Sumerlaeota bacterium]